MGSSSSGHIKNGFVHSWSIIPFLQEVSLWGMPLHPFPLLFLSIAERKEKRSYPYTIEEEGQGGLHIYYAI
jgi:hypothetical protein